MPSMDEMIKKLTYSASDGDTDLWWRWQPESGLVWYTDAESDVDENQKDGFYPSPQLAIEAAYSAEVCGEDPKYTADEVAEIIRRYSEQEDD